MKRSEKLDKEYAKMIECKPVKKRKIKNFYLCSDAFGPMPVWSIQHYNKGTEDSYMLPYGSSKKWMKLLQELDKKLYDFEILIDGTVYYANLGKNNDKDIGMYDLVVHLHIDEFRLFTREKRYSDMEEEHEKFLKENKKEKKK